MPDMEKVIKGLECCQLAYECKPYERCPYSNGYECGDCDINQLHYDALVLLKKQETHKFFVDESGKITPLPVVVRCKDCANGEVRTQSWDGVQYVECHAHEEEGYDHEDGHPLDWFCADGKRRTE